MYTAVLILDHQNYASAAIIIYTFLYPYAYQVAANYVAMVPSGQIFDRYSNSIIDNFSLAFEVIHFLTNV